MWDSFSDQSHGARRDVNPGEFRLDAQTVRQFMVRYSTTDGSSFQSRASGIPGRILFIETNDLLPVGSMLTVELIDLHDPVEARTASGRVVWICRTADQFNFAPGMGVHLLEFPTSQGCTGPDVDPSMPPGSPRLLF